MSSDVFISNLALAHIGKPSINSLTEARAEAAACRRFYDHSRRKMLQLSAWTFAKKRVNLAAASDNDFDERWLYQYARPSEALSILRVIPPISPRFSVARPPFEVRENSVYTNITPAVCEFIFDQTDAARFSPLFCEALSYDLASYLANALLRSDKMRNMMRNETKEALSLAITADAAQDAPTYINGESADSPDYNEARY